MSEMGDTLAIAVEALEVFDTDDEALAAWIESMCAQLTTMQIYFDENFPDAEEEQPSALREPSPARGSAGGTDALKPGVHRIIPKPGA